MRKLRLVPPDSRLGWTPYAWLVYLLTFFIEPVVRTQHGRAGWLYWTATLIGVAIFFAAYFRAHWVRGRQLMGMVAVLAGLAIAYAPFNTGSAVFFVYAAGAAAFLERRGQAARVVLFLAVLGAVTAWLVSGPLYFWIVAIAITLLVGGVNIHFAQESRTQHKLRLAQDEVAHLATVAERERIARDLHDVLGHTLSLIVLKSELAGQLAERDPERAAAEIRDVEHVARRTLHEVREAIRGYRSTLREEAARAAALLKAAGIRCDIELDTLALPQQAEETLALALREAVTNVTRHSEAAACSIRLERLPTALVLVVEDDGRGSTAPDGYGLRGMRERVEAFGGRIERQAGTGMRLCISVPNRGAHPGAPFEGAARVTAAGGAGQTDPIGARADR